MDRVTMLLTTTLLFVSITSLLIYIAEASGLLIFSEMEIAGMITISGIMGVLVGLLSPYPEEVEDVTINRLREKVAQLQRENSVLQRIASERGNLELMELLEDVKYYLDRYQEELREKEIMMSNQIISLREAIESLNNLEMREIKPMVEQLLRDNEMIFQKLAERKEEMNWFRES
ncbi:hypothetical protein DRN46_06870, partial [Thermococci archaeon]